MSVDYAGNPVSAYLTGGVIFLGVLWAFLVARRLARRAGGLWAELIGQVHAWEVAFVALGLGARELALPDRLGHLVHLGVVLVVAYRVVGLLSAVAAFAIRRGILSDPSDASNRDIAATATLAVRGLIWVGAVLFVLSNAGYNVSSMIAGLGIGGVAVALAAQAVLGDLFAALAIYLDKPFVTGDFIVVGDAAGTVDHIGIKTTRVRALSGEMLVFPNSTLTSTRIQNFRLMRERRVVLTFAVPLATPVETLRAIPSQVRAAVAKNPDLRFERSHLSQYTDGGFRFESVWWVTNPDYNAHMDRQQDVLLSLLESLRADGVPLARPEHSVLLEGKAP